MLGFRSLTVFDLGLRFVDKSRVFLLIEEISVADVLVRVVAGERLWRHFLVGVTEVDVAHVIRVVKEIRVERIVVPEVMLVVLALPVTVDHEVEEACHPERRVGPEDGAC